MAQIVFSRIICPTHWKILDLRKKDEMKGGKKLMENCRGNFILWGKLEVTQTRIRNFEVKA